MGKVVLSEERIQEICDRVGSQLSELIKNEERIPVLVGVLKGSLNFMFDLMKRIKNPIYTDYVQVSSYQGTTNTGHLKLIKDLSFDCENRTVIIIEDIVDTGATLQYLIELISKHNPKRILTCALLNKEHARKVPLTVDFVGHELVDDDFLIGYGLDYFELERNTPLVYAIDEEELEKLNKFLDKDLEG